jgi:hypothetical protein
MDATKGQSVFSQTLHHEAASGIILSVAAVLGATMLARVKLATKTATENLTHMEDKV